MRKVILMLGGLSLTGCRAFDPSLLAPAGAPLAQRLPRLTAEVQPPQFCFRFDSSAVARDLDTLFARQVREAVAAPRGAPQGFAVLTARCVRYGQGGGYSYVSGLTLGALTVFGFPWSRYHCTVDVQVDVRNRRRELVGTYYAQGKAVLPGGLYRRTNYQQKDCDRTLYLQCVRQGLEQIMPQLQAEGAQLQQGLLP